MPRRNRRPRSATNLRREPTDTAELTTDQLAMHLVLDGHCDPLILGPLMRPFRYPGESKQ